MALAGRVFCSGEGSNFTIFRHNKISHWNTEISYWKKKKKDAILVQGSVLCYLHNFYWIYLKTFKGKHNQVTWVTEAGGLEGSW